MRSLSALVPSQSARTRTLGAAMVGIPIGIVERAATSSMEHTAPPPDALQGDSAVRHVLARSSCLMRQLRLLGASTGISQVSRAEWQDAQAV
jgi:hypothetical protein